MSIQSGRPNISLKKRRESPLPSPPPLSSPLRRLFSTSSPLLSGDCSSPPPLSSLPGDCFSLSTVSGLTAAGCAATPLAVGSAQCLKDPPRAPSTPRSPAVSLDQRLRLQPPYGSLMEDCAFIYWIYLGPLLFWSMKDPELVGATKPLSKTLGFNPCSGGVCGPPAVRPLVDTGAMVFVVFGILGVNRTQRTDNHVIGDTVRTAAQPLHPQTSSMTASSRPDTLYITCYTSLCRAG